MPATRSAPRPRAPRPSLRHRVPHIRRATARDHDALRALEDSAFQPWRRASAKSLRRSLASPHQSVWLIPHPEPDSGQVPPIGGLLVLWHHRSRLRVYDIATHADVRGQGYGLALMRHAEALAKMEGCRDVSLEADAHDAALVAWYRGQGYEVVETMPRFYTGGRAAVRLRKAV